MCVGCLSLVCGLAINAYVLGAVVCRLLYGTMMVVGSWSLLVGCWLLVIVVCCASSLLFVVCCTLCVMCCLLDVDSLLSVFVVCCLLCGVELLLFLAC